MSGPACYANHTSCVTVYWNSGTHYLLSSVVTKTIILFMRAGTKQKWTNYTAYTNSPITRGPACRNLACSRLLTNSENSSIESENSIIDHRKTFCGFSSKSTRIPLILHVGSKSHGAPLLRVLPTKLGSL